MKNIQLRHKVFAVSGIKNSGKTTLIGKLITRLSAKGYKVGVIKHDGHEFEADHPGTDSYKHKAAGAENVIVYSKSKVMMIKDVETPDIDTLIQLQEDMDIIVLEGMKYSKFPKIEIVRQEISQEIVCDPHTLLAIVTDVPMKEENIPIIGLNDIDELLIRVEEYIQNGK